MAAGSETISCDATAPRSRWARAVAGDVEALRELAGSYWYCAYAWWRCAGLDAGRGATATLASFTRWLGEAPPCAEDSGAARMREWLPARLAELATAGVKLAGRAALEIDSTWAAQRYTDEPHGDPNAIFQRRWALTVLELSTTTLQGEYAARGEDALFAELLPFAGFESGGDERYSAAAARAGRTSGAMRKAVFDFRTRQREVIREYVTDTLAAPADVESEITALLCAGEAPSVQMTAAPGMEMPAPAAAPLPTTIRTLRPDEIFARAMQSVRMTSAGPGGWQPPSIEEATLLFPQYEIAALLGRGGMGAVYKARQPALDRFVAIKLLPLEVSVDRDFADRFVREARAMARLSHPNIIAVYDFGATAEGHLFFVMEFVEGANLQRIIHGPGIPPAQALALTGQVCTALGYAHGKGIVHRDIKPANVMVDLEGQVKVADFGLARLTDPEAEQVGHTVTGMVMGTPDYMAPEQKRGLAVDHRADIYSVGVLLYEALCRETPQGIFDPPSVRIGCDPRIDAIVMRAMQQAPERRYQSTQEMKVDVAAAAAQLAAALTPEPPPDERRFSTAETPARASDAPDETGVQAAPGVGRAMENRRSWKLPIGIAAALAVVAGGVLWQWSERGPAPLKPAARINSSAGWTNLLALVDVKRDSLMAPWTLENGALRSPQRIVAENEDAPGSHQTFAFPLQKPPRNYDLRYRLTRNARGFAVAVPFVRGAETADLRIDGGHGFRFAAAQRRGERLGKSRQDKLWLPVGETHELLIEVRDALVRISFDGAVQIEHAGPLPSERQHDFAFYPPGRGREPFIGIGVCGGDLTIHSAEFREVDKDGKPGGR